MRTAPFAAIAVLALTAGQLPSQEDVDFDREIAFLRGLAKDWSFVDLASDHIADLRRQSLTDVNQRKLAQIGAEVLFLGARRLTNMEKRQAVLAESLQKFEDYINQFGREAEAAPVLATMAEACETYGSFLSQKLTLTKDPDKRKELEEEALGVYQKGIKASNDAMTALAPRKADSREAKIDFFLSWMRKGTLLREWAKTLEKDRKVKAQESINTLEEMVIEAGEETPIGVKGLLEMAVSQDTLGQTADAMDSFQGTVDVIAERIKDTENPLNQPTKELMFRLLEEAYQYLTDILVREGQIDETLAKVVAYEKTRDELKLPTNPNVADMIQLNGAQARVDQGGKENMAKALDLAKEIANRHPADFVGLRARDIINSAIATSGVVVGADALYQAAQGEFQNRNYDAAVGAYKRVLREMQTPEEKQQFGLRSWAQIGFSFVQRQRYLEAVYAFMDGLRQYGKSSNEEDAAKVADALQSAVGRLRNQGSDKEKLIERLKTETDNIIKDFGGSATRDKIFFKEAQDAIAAGQYDKAIQNLQTIAKTDVRWEVARAMLAFALMKQGDFARARAEIDAYLKHVKDPLNEIPASDSQRRSLRDMAIADVAYFQGKMLSDEAFGDDKKPGDAKKKPDVVQAFRNYAKQHGRVRPAYASLATFDLVRALIDLERMPEAEAEYAALAKEAGDAQKSRVVSNLSIYLFKARTAIVESIDQEIKALEAASGKARELRDARDKLRVEIRKALNLAKTSVDLEREPDYGLMRNASKMALRIDDFDQAELLLEKIVAVHANSAPFKRDIDVYIKPELAEVKMLKGDFNSALALVDQSLAANKGNLQLHRLRARALGGWIDYDSEGKIRQRQGLQRYEEAYKELWENYGRYVRAKFKDFSYEWYEFYLDGLDLARKAATKNTNFLQTAIRFYNIPKSTDEFATLKALPNGPKLHRLFEHLRPQ